MYIVYSFAGYSKMWRKRLPWIAHYTADIVKHPEMFSKLHGSSCMWIVPGTVDPMED